MSIVCAIALSPVALFAQDEDVELITPKSDWKYNDSGENLGTAWREPGFDDSEWKTGQAPLGYGDSGVANTTIESGPSDDKIITQYFRKNFIAEGPGQFTTLILRVQRDDGIVVYINGDRVLVDNLEVDTGTGEVAYDARAIASIDGSNEKAWIETARTPAVLVQGAPFMNTIAVEVHQSSPTSSDTRFDAELILTKAIPAYGEVRVGIQTKFSEAGNGRDFFKRNTLADPPEIEMNWTSLTPATGGQFALTIDGGVLPEEDFTFFDENDEVDTQFFIWGQTLREWESEKIDTRNYDNVQVKVGVRTYNEGTKFESSDYFRGELDVSTNGENFDTVKWFELKGGGKKALDWTTVVGAETMKTAMVPASAEEPGPDWMNPNFDDSGWISGVMGFGFDSPGGSFEEYWGNDISDVMKGNNSACYIRIPFTVTDLASFTDLQLRMRYDDGYVAFINGTEVARENAPETLTWDASATKSHSDSLAVAFEDVDVKAALENAELDTILNEGDNILTIIGMNKGSGGSDFLIDTELRLGKPGDGPPASLEAVDAGIENRLSTLTSEVGSVADSVASLKVRFEAKCSDDEVIYFDNVRTLGDPIAADSFFAYMQLETGWDLEDPRIQPHSDPDGDGMPNLLEYAFGAPPQVASQTTMVKGEEVSYLPEWTSSLGGEQPLKTLRFGFANVSYRQISAPLALDGDDATTEGFHLQDIRYVAQISRGELDENGEMIWTDGTAGGEPVFEQREPFKENEDGTVQVNLSGLRPLTSERQTYLRILVRIVGFEQIEN